MIQTASAKSILTTWSDSFLTFRGGYSSLRKRADSQQLPSYTVLTYVMSDSHRLWFCITEIRLHKQSSRCLLKNLKKEVIFLWKILSLHYAPFFAMVNPPSQLIHCDYLFALFITGVITPHISLIPFSVLSPCPIYFLLFFLFKSSTEKVRVSNSDKIFEGHVAKVSIITMGDIIV